MNKRRDKEKKNFNTNYNTMSINQLKFLCISTIVCLSLLSCGGSDDDENGGGGTGTQVNANKNTHPTNKYVTRLEFPRLKGGSSIVITHNTYEKYGVNYSVEWDVEKKSQRWTAYQMYQGYQGNAGRYNGDPQYPYDPDLPSQYYHERDYFWGSGFDHGHMIPSADRQFSYSANKQTFYLTNMQPQYNRFNANLWADLEAKVRKWTPQSSSDTLYVCTGGTIDNEEHIITRIAGVLIAPKYFYKALLIRNSMGYKAIGFWMQNENVDRGGDDLKKYACSIDELEDMTGIDFFCNLPDNIEDKVERSYALNSWGLN